MSKTKYVGAIDVDANNFNIALISKSTGELLHFKTAATVYAMRKNQKRYQVLTGFIHLNV